MRKTILITGGAGFLGMNLLQALMKKYKFEDIELVVIDNFKSCSSLNIRHFVEQNSAFMIKILKFNICHKKCLKYIKEKFNFVDEVYHFASIASPPMYKKFPKETLDVGYIGTKNMLELCLYYKQKTSKSPKFLFSSTSEVYGDPTCNPQTESYYGNVNTVGDRSCYDESKRVAETLVMTYHKLYDLDTRIVRIFNTYGPFMSLSDGRIVTEIMRGALLGTELKIFNTGNQTRSLSYVDDTIEMILKVMTTDFHYPINVGNDEEISINRLIEIFKQTYNNIYKKQPTLKIHYMSQTHDKDDPKVRKPCLELNKSVLGSIDATPLENGLWKTYMYFETLIDSGF